MTYNQEQVINFLLGLEFASLSIFMYTRTALVANYFGITTKTANKWIDRAVNSGAIEATNTGFVRKDRVAAQQKTVVNAAIESGKVASLTRHRLKKHRKAIAL